MKFVLASHRRNLIRLQCMRLFTQDYAVVTLWQLKYRGKQTECFPKGKIYSEKSLFTPKKETLIILNARRETRKRFKGTISPFRSVFNLSTRAWHVFQIFDNTVQNIKNRSIRIVFQYKFTIKPVIFQPLNSQNC